TIYEAALCIAPSGIMMMLIAPLSGWLERLFGARMVLLIGTSMMIFAYGGLLIWGDAVWHLVVANAIIGVGIAFSFAAMPMIIMRAVPPHETGVSNGLNSLFRSIGTSSAAAVIGGMLAA